MSIVITGATGKLGRHVVEALLERKVQPAEIVATGRSIDKLSDLAARGVQVRAMDYTDAASVAEGLEGATTVLLISGTDVGHRAEQHRTVIEAAKAEGVELLVYTSIANADSTAMKLAADHKATEAILKDSAVPFTLLRIGWYLENYTEQLQGTLAHGVLAGSAGEGRVSAATRRDYAEAAAAVLLAENQAGKVYELGGDNAFSLAELAQEISAVANKPVVYQDLPVSDYAELLAGFGLPQVFADVLADSDLGIARGDLLVRGSDLRTLIGRPTTPMTVAVSSAIAAA